MRYTEQLTAAVLALIASSGIGPATAHTIGSNGAPTSIPMVAETDLVGRAVYVAEGERIGRIDAVEADWSGRIAVVEVLLGKIGFGPKTVRVTGDKITITQDEFGVWLAMTEEEVCLLPSIDDEHD